MPSFAWALQKIRGYLYPFGIFYLLYSKFFNKKINLYLIGIHPDYQKRGVTGIIFNSFIQTLKKKGIKICRRTPELTDNISIDKIWENFSPELIKTRSTFKKSYQKTNFKDSFLYSPETNLSLIAEKASKVSFISLIS